MKLRKVCRFLDDYLQVRNFKDVSNNGLQVEGGDEVERIAFAVDASMDSFKAAKAVNADLLVVHHGLIWGGIDYVRGIKARRIGFLLENKLSLYAAHLPLDAHREVGNNALILREVGAEPLEEFGDYKGVKIGFSSIMDEERRVGEIAEKLGAIKVLPFGDEKVKKIAAVSGRGGFAVSEAIENGVELLITGEPEHEVYHIAKEGNLNVIFLGHYESEKFGVKALSEVVRKNLGLETIFLDIPTNL